LESTWESPTSKQTHTPNLIYILKLFFFTRADTWDSIDKRTPATDLISLYGFTLRVQIQILSTLERSERASGNYEKCTLNASFAPRYLADEVVGRSLPRGTPQIRF